MRLRLWLIAVSVFWSVMIVWLWRTEFGQRRQPGSIPSAVVWKKVLTAPDPSNMEVRLGTNVIGYCHWRPDVGQEMATGARMSEDEPVEGLVDGLSHYSLDLEGSVALPDFPTRLRFSLRLHLDTNQVWQTFDAHASMRPDLYELSANAQARTVRLRVDAGADQLDRTFSFADFQNPQKLLSELGGPLFPAMVAATGVRLSTNQLPAGTFGMNWTARNDSLKVGEERLRAYSLETKLLDHYRVRFYISPVGELLKAEFPGNLVLLNQALSGLRQSHD